MENERNAIGQKLSPADWSEAEILKRGNAGLIVSPGEAAVAVTGGVTATCHLSLVRKLRPIRSTWCPKMLV